MKNDAWGSQAFLIEQLKKAAKLCEEHGYFDACLILLEKAVYLAFERIAAEEYFALSRPETLSTYFKNHEDMRLRDITARMLAGPDSGVISDLFDDLDYLEAYQVH